MEVDDCGFDESDDAILSQICLSSLQQTEKQSKSQVNLVISEVKDPSSPSCKSPIVGKRKSLSTSLGGKTFCYCSHLRLRLAIRQSNIK